MEAYINLLKEQNPEMAKYLDLMQPLFDKKDPEIIVPEIDFELEDKIKKIKKINQKLFTIVEGLKSQLEHELLQNDNLAKVAKPGVKTDNRDISLFRNQRQELSNIGAMECIFGTVNDTANSAAEGHSAAELPLQATTDIETQ